MQIVFGASGTRGDVQPALVLALEMKRRGHDVQFFAPASLVAWCESFGIPSVAAGIDFLELLNEIGPDILRALPRLRDDIVRQDDTVRAHVSRADLVVSCSIFTAGLALAEKLGVPHHFLIPIPSILPSGTYPTPIIPFQQLPAWVNRFSWWLNTVTWNFMFRSTLNHVRARAELPPIDDVWDYFVRNGVIVASEPRIAPVAHDVGVPAMQPGAFFLDDPTALDPVIVDFLDAGDPPLYVGFGSMVHDDPEATVQYILQAVRAAGVRAIIARGWSGLDAEAEDGVLFVGPTPHAKLFPRCSAIVHHGGAGTVAAAARAGVPQIVIPHLLDQHFWAYRLYRAGLAPRAFSLAGFVPERLAASIATVAGDRRMIDRARQFTAEMKTDAVRVTADLLEHRADAG